MENNRRLEAKCKLLEEENKHLKQNKNSPIHKQMKNTKSSNKPKVYLLSIGNASAKIHKANAFELKKNKSDLDSSDNRRLC